MRLFFLVLARNRKYVEEKIEELEKLKVPYRIVCGERMNHSSIVYRPPRGKYDAINYGVKIVPKDTEIVVLNDVDTKIHNFHATLKYFKDKRAGLVYAPELVREGPQAMFFGIFNPIREKIPLAGSGELLLIRKEIFERIVPIKPCKADDTYIMFKTLELGYKTMFCKECQAETKRTKTPKEEEMYKRRTVAGIYQALSYTRPPRMIKIFYIILPIASPMLLVLGRKGYYWMKGILLGMLDHLQGDETGSWQPIERSEKEPEKVK